MFQIRILFIYSLRKLSTGLASAAFTD
ncbi:MAG: YSIRK-type signal peptide-containing protein [Haliscomenobacter sp.]|nr:YSIRK-type signal peptide-containing protein [Haliscomenobacter sp.]